MTILCRFYDNDLRAMLAEAFKIPKDQITSIYTEEEDEYGNIDPVFYLEAEIESECNLTNKRSLE